MIFFAVQMCFKRGDISNLMEKLVGWKSIHIGNEGKYNCNGFEFKFGIRLADGIHKEKRIKIHFTKYKSSTRVVSILRFLVILILCIIWRDVFYTKCNKYCTTLDIFCYWYYVIVWNWCVIIIAYIFLFRINVRCFVISYCLYNYWTYWNDIFWLIELP